jgi:hypothetical protein
VSREPVSEYSRRITAFLISNFNFSLLDNTSYNTEIQSVLYDVLSNNEKLKLDIKKAAILREYSETGSLDTLNNGTIEDILLGNILKKKNRTPLPVQSLKIGGKRLSQYFRPEQQPKEIEDELFEALEYYRTNKKV